MSTHNQTSAHARDFIARYSRIANLHRKGIRQLTDAVDVVRDRTYPSIEEGLIADKAAMRAVIEEQAAQIHTLTTMLRALGHYAPGEGFKA